MPEPAHSQGLRRAVSQAGLIVALLAVFSLSATAAGTSALLVTVGNDRALSAAVAEADRGARADGPDVTTVLVAGADRIADGTAQANAAKVVPLTRQALLEAARPYPARVSLWTTTPMRFLGGNDLRRGYLLDADTVGTNAKLVSGAWPAPPAADGGTIAVAIPATTATALRVTIGSELRLSEKRQHEGPVPPGYSLVVVGIFTPSATPDWTRDTLLGQGYDADRDQLPAYGPFVVAPGTLETLDAPVNTVSAVMDPDLGGDAVNLPTLLRGLAGVEERIEDEAGTAVSLVLVTAPLGAAFDAMRAEVSLSNSLVLAVFLVVLALGTATAALVARVLAGRRAGEVTLLRDRGASARQLALGASVEALAIAVAAVLVAAPLSLVAYGALAPAPGLAASWPGFVASAATLALPVGLALLAGAVLPAAVVVLVALPERARRGRGVISGPVARSGIDVMVALVAAVAYLQLRSHVITPGAVDPLLVAAPAACAIAVAALAARFIPFLLRAANAAAARSRGLVVPMAGWHLARAGAAQGTFLLVLAAAVGTLGVTFLGTWSMSQGDQAAAMVGADLVVAQAGGPGTAQILSEATGGTVAAVADRAVALGTRSDGVTGVALDASLADRMIRGRLPDGATWSQAMDGLAPKDAGVPITVGAGPMRLTVTGGLAAGAVGVGLVTPVVTATPTLVLTDESGYTTTLAGPEAALDGRPHVLELPTPGQQALPAGRWRIVAINLLLDDQTTPDLIAWGTSKATMSISIAVDGASSDGGTWGATSGSGPDTVTPGEVAVRAGTVEATFSYSVLELSWESENLQLLSFPASAEVPVAMTEDLARELGLAPGARIGLIWATTRVEAVLVRTIPYVPSQVRDAAVLADLTSLTRALQSAGMVGTTTDAWWVSSPRDGAAEAVRAAGDGPVSTTAETTAALRDGPLRTPLRVAWLLAIGAAIGLALTGSAAHAAAEAQQRASTIAKVRAIGVSRADALTSHLLQHAAVTVTAVVLGAVSGAILAWLLAPLLVVAPGGQRAVPPPALVWSAAPTLAVVGAILAGALLVGVPAAVVVVRRSTVAALRAGEAL